MSTRKKKHLSPSEKLVADRLEIDIGTNWMRAKDRVSSSMDSDLDPGSGSALGSNLGMNIRAQICVLG